MRAQHLQQTKAQWYDRNPSYAGASNIIIASAPTGPTVLWTYTVPALRKCVIESTQATMVRDTAAAVAGQRQARVFIITAALQITVIPTALSTSNVVNERIDMFGALQAILLAADTILFVQEDLSVAGTCSFIGAFKGTEYDAQ